MASNPTPVDPGADAAVCGGTPAAPVVDSGDRSGVGEKLAADGIGEDVAPELEPVKEGGIGSAGDGGREFADEKLEAAVGVDEIGAGVVEEDEMAKSGDAGLNLGEGSGAEEKGGCGSGVESSDFELTENLNGPSFKISDLDVAGEVGSKVADMMDRDGDSVMYDLNSETIHSDLFLGESAGVGSDTEGKGDVDIVVGGDTETEGMKDFVFVLDDLSPVEMDQGNQQEDADTVLEDAMADFGNTLQVGEPEDAKEAETAPMPRVTAKKNDSRDKYYMPFKDEKAAFSASDLVWGKIRSHPWWPGQIFESTDASEMALRHKNKGNFLIAYFGDQSFAWNEKRQLKPFFTHFPKMEKQSNLESFTDAVDDALEEVARRIEVGLTCSCFADEACAAMKCKTVVNAGLREGTASAAADRSLIGNSFEPAKLLHFVYALAEDPYGGVDRLELVTLEAQLNAFYRYKGYPRLPGALGLVEDNVEALDSTKKEPEEDATDPSILTSSAASSGKRKGRGRGSSSVRRKRISKRKHISKDGSKEKKLSDLTEEKDVHDTVSGRRRGSRGGLVSRSSGRKRKAAGQSAGESKKKRLDSLGDLEAKTPSPRAAKVGERISRIAGKMTGSPTIKSNRETKGSGSKKGTPEVYSSLSEVLSELRLLARDPMRGHSFVPTLISFLNGFWTSNGSKDEKPVVTVGSKRSRRKSAKAMSADADMPVQDSYWSDVVFEESSEEEESSSEDEKKRKSRLQQRKKKVKSEGKERTLPLNTLDAGQNSQIGSEIPCTQQELVEQRTTNDSGEKIVEEYTPTALILSFTELDTLPSGADLVSIFSPFGPLEEAETEVLNEEKRAKVVFRKRLDAETAYNSARKCSLFGPALVSYRLKYQSTPEVSLHAKRQEDGALPNGGVNATLPDGGALSDNKGVDNT